MWSIECLMATWWFVETLRAHGLKFIHLICVAKKIVMKRVNYFIHSRDMKENSQLQAKYLFNLLGPAWTVTSHFQALHQQTRQRVLIFTRSAMRNVCKLDATGGCKQTKKLIWTKQSMRNFIMHLQSPLLRSLTWRPRRLRILESSIVLLSRNQLQIYTWLYEWVVNARFWATSPSKGLE